MKCRIDGRVQGVFYRAATAERANGLGLSGWVRNLGDGSVELVASGPSANLELLLAWLWQGPPKAEVRSVVLEEHARPVAAGFKILR